jgi:hypothetical protein
LQKSLPCANAQATLCGTTQTYIIADREEGRTHNRGFAAMLADEYIPIILSLSAVVPADGILFGFLLLTSSSYFQSSAVPGWTFNEYQHSSNPCPLAAIFADYKHLAGYFYWKTHIFIKYSQYKTAKTRL